MSVNGNMVDVVQSSTLLSHRGNDIREDLQNQPIQSSPRRIEGGTRASMTLYHLPTSSVRNTQQFKGQKTNNHNDASIPTIYILEGVGSGSPVQRNKIGANHTVAGSGGGTQSEHIVHVDHNGYEPNLPSTTSNGDVKLVEQFNGRKRKKPEEESISEGPEQVDESYDSDSSTSVDNELEKKINLMDDVYNAAVMSRKPLLSDGSDPVLILNLYQSHVGYTFCVYLPPEGICPPSHVIPYSERYLLDCVDSGKIPSKLITKYQVEDNISLIRDGNSLLTEIRDYRRFSDSNSKPKVPVVRQVVLTQSVQTIQADLSVLIQKSLKDRREWKRLRKNRLKQNTAKSRPSRDSGDSNSDDDTDEEGEMQQPLLNDKLTYDQRLELEKQLVNSTAGPLCLDPSPRVGFVKNRMQFAKLKWNTKEFRKRAKVWFNNDYSSKKRKTSDPSTSALGSHSDIPKTGKWQDHVYLGTSIEQARSLTEGRTDFEPFCEFVTAWKSKNQPNQKPVSLKLPEGNIEPPEVDYPINCDDLKKAGLFEIPEQAVLRTLPVENSVKKIEEYILETERRKRPHTTKLSIYQRNGIECYFGELEMESFGDNAPKPQSNKPDAPLPSTKCQFDLGCSRSVTLYVKQFSDIFTEDGRRPCKITYQKVGQPAQVVFVNSYKNQTHQASSSHPVVISTNQNNVSSANATASSVSVPTPSHAATSLGSSANSVVSVPVGPAPRISAGQQQSSSVPVVAGKAIRVPISISSQSSNVKPIISSQQHMVRLNNNSGSSPATASVPNSSASTMTSTIITTTTSTSPQTNPSQRSVQVVLPQPRAIQQQQTSQMATAVSSASPVQVQIQPQQHQQLSQIYTVSANPNTMTIPTSTNPTGANVNFNLNVNSAGIVSLTPQQVLTRPHIFNVNLQQQNQQRVTIQQHNQRLTIQQPQKLTAVQQQQQRLTIQPQQQQNSIRIKQQPTLATLLLTGIHPNQGSKPITVAIQPQPQNIMGQPQGNMTSPILTSPMDQSLSSPIMIAPGGGNNVNPNSLSVNLNAISLDGQIIAVSSAPHGSLQPGTTYHVAHPGSSMAMGLSSASGAMNAMTPLSAMNFIRLANSNTQLHRQGSTVSLMNPQGIIISSNNTGPGPSLTSGNQNRGLQQLSGSKPAEQHQIEEISVPDLNALLGGGGQGQQQGKNIDGLNLNLNLNVNLNLSGATTTQDAANVMYEDPGSSNPGINSATHVKSLQHNGSQSISIKTEPGTLDVPQPVIKQEVLEPATSPHHQRNMNVMGVDSFLNTLCEPNSSVDLAQKLEGFGNNSNINIVSSSLSPTKSYVATSHPGGGSNGGISTSSSMITLSDLLGSPPIGVVSSSTQSCQTITGNNLLSPVSSSIASSTPRLSALLAGTPSADTVTVSHDGGISIVDSSTSVSSYGNLLDRLAASLQQQQQQPQSGNVARVAGSRLNPIATATPNVVLEHPVLAATLTQQGNILVNTSGASGGNHTVSSNRPTAYRQIAPAPAPGVSHQQNQSHQLINLLGMGIVNNAANASSSSSSNTQQTIRINSPGSQSSPSSVNSKSGINLNHPGRS